MNRKLLKTPLLESVNFEFKSNWWIHVLIFLFVLCFLRCQLENRSFAIRQWQLFVILFNQSIMSPVLFGSYFFYRKYKKELLQDPEDEIENSGRSIFEIRIPNFCYIQVIVFDLSYVPVAAVGTWQVRYHEKIVKI